MEIDLNHGFCNGGDLSSLKSSKSSLKSSTFTELWHACAGPLTNLPNKGNVVVYFPQGHMEHIVSQSSTHFSAIDVPSLGLQPQVFCKVEDVQLLANKENDEVFTKLTLLPLSEGNLQEGEEEGDGVKVKETKSTPQMFCKTLTASDTSTHGGFSVPRRAAEDCFPPLDYKQQRPSQELVAKDLHGVEWKFRHIYRGQPRRHLLTTGWSIFVSQKNLVSGDAVLFLRGEGGELRLGTRRAARPRNVLPCTIFDNFNSFADVLAPVADAIRMDSTFHVFYGPRSSRADFVVPYVKYINSASNIISIGTRFKMKFSMDESPERRFSGTVTGVSDIDSYKWPNSKWRSLMVRWDEDIGNNHQERISPWEIDFSGAAVPLLSIQSSPRLKKLRAAFHSTASEHPNNTQGGYLDFEESIRSSKVLQGQENVGPISPLNGRDKMYNSFDFRVQPLMHPSFSSNGLMGQGTNFVRDLVKAHRQPPYANIYSGFLGSNDFNRFPKVLQGQEICSLKSLTEKSQKTDFSLWGPPRTGLFGNGGCNVLDMYQKTSDHGFYPLGSKGSRSFTRFTVNPSFDGNEVTRNDVLALKIPMEENPIGKTSVSPVREANSNGDKDEGTSEGSSCKLFGFPLNETPPMADAQSLNKRSCTKVHKQGNKVGRAIDLSKMSSYNDLFGELEALFNMEGILGNSNGGWRLLYTDEENDMMVVGDDPWDEFARMATKIHIYTVEEVEKLMSGGVISDDTSSLEEAPAMVDTAKSSSVGQLD